MMRLAVLFTALVAVATAVPAGAQAPTPSPHGYTNTALQHKAKPMTFSNPGNPKYNPGTRSGRDCISGRGANAGQQTINPSPDSQGGDDRLDSARPRRRQRGVVHDEGPTGASLWTRALGPNGSAEGFAKVFR